MVKKEEGEPRVRIEASTKEDIWMQFDEWWKKRSEEVRQEFKQDMILMLESIQKSDSLFTRQIVAIEGQAKTLKRVADTLEEIRNIMKQE